MTLCKTTANKNNVDTADSMQITSSNAKAMFQPSDQFACVKVPLPSGPSSSKVAHKLHVAFSAAVQPHSRHWWHLRIINNAFTAVVQALLIIRKHHNGREWGLIAAESVTDSFAGSTLCLHSPLVVLARIYPSF